MIRGALLAICLALVGCEVEPKGRTWIMIEDPFGAALRYGNVEPVFSIGCSDGKARVSVASFHEVMGTDEVTVQLSDSASAFSRVDRDVRGIVAEANLSVEWIDHLARADVVSVEYSGQNLAPLTLPQDWRDALVNRCRALIATAPQFP